MELKVINQQGAETSTLAVSDEVFGREYNEPLIHQLVISFMANGRQGTRAQKNRNEVKHSTKKPWRQKGTGRARSGMSSSPIWRGGGVTFPNRPDENFSQKVNRKMYRVGMSSILSELVRQDRLTVLDSIQLSAPKTKEFVGIMSGLGLSKVLIVTDDFDEKLFLAARNVPHVAVVSTHGMDPVALVSYDKVLVTQQAVKQIEEWLV